MVSMVLSMKNEGQVPAERLVHSGMQKAISYHYGDPHPTPWDMGQKEGSMDSRKAHFLVEIARTCARAVPFVLGVLAVLSVPTGPAMAQPNLFVTSQLDHTVKEYDGTTGAFVRNAATG